MHPTHQLLTLEKAALPQLPIFGCVALKSEVVLRIPERSELSREVAHSLIGGDGSSIQKGNVSKDDKGWTVPGSILLEDTEELRCLFLTIRVQEIPRIGSKSLEVRRAVFAI